MAPGKITYRSVIYIPTLEALQKFLNDSAMFRAEVGFQQIPTESISEANAEKFFKGKAPWCGRPMNRRSFYNNKTVVLIEAYASSPTDFAKNYTSIMKRE